MCPPQYFDVTYAINAWMDTAVPVDQGLAMRQWTGLVAAYRSHGHRVEELAPVKGLVDMVFAANGATVVDGLVLPARFATAQRRPEAEFHRAWHRSHRAALAGASVPEASAINEGEGDFAVLSDRILAGYGFRTSRHAHRELAALTGREVVSLRLVDPRFYHLDVALTVLDDAAGHIAYYPPAFTAAGRRTLRRLYPDAIIATEADALLLGLNCVSDGLHVFAPAGAGHLIGELGLAGYQPVPIDLSELAKSGGGIKCCTQELRPAPLPMNLARPSPVPHEPRHHDQ
ncbi:MAG: amidinotransferase [Propionibacteriaceae bacterium]|jgi:N-dimethylarginine dimethylaminohydrolase|nr:amidinotransferase [Propionibacteriaceae bacterium]